MRKRALAEHRPWLLASLAGAVAFYLLSDAAIGGIQLMILKGSAVGLLAGYAFRRGASSDGRLLGIVMAFSAIGDVTIEVSFIAGGAAFFFAHVVAIALYLCNRRAGSVINQRLTGAALLLVTPVIAFLLTFDWSVALYALSLGGMACAAWLSRFPRYRVGAGAVLFILSDWLIFSRMGFIGENAVADWLVWPLYYCGQLLIATGVVQTLCRDGTSKI